MRQDEPVESPATPRSDTDLKSDADSDFEPPGSSPGYPITRRTRRISNRSANLDDSGRSRPNSSYTAQHSDISGPEDEGESSAMESDEESEAESEYSSQASTIDAEMRAEQAKKAKEKRNEMSIRFPDLPCEEDFEESNGAHLDLLQKLQRSVDIASTGEDLTFLQDDFISAENNRGDSQMVNSNKSSSTAEYVTSEPGSVGAVQSDVSSPLDVSTFLTGLGPSDSGPPESSIMSPVEISNGENPLYNSMPPLVGQPQLQGQDLIAAQQFLQTQQNYLRQQGVLDGLQPPPVVSGYEGMPTDQLMLSTGQDSLLSPVNEFTPMPPGGLQSPDSNKKKKSRSRSKKAQQSASNTSTTPTNADNKMDKLLSSTNTKEDQIDMLLGDSSFNFDNLKDLSAQKGGFDLDELLGECTPINAVDPNSLFTSPHSGSSHRSPVASTTPSLLATTPPSATSNSVWDNLDKVPSFEESIMNPKRSLRKSGEFEIAPTTPVPGNPPGGGSWMNGSMGLYTCVCGAVLPDNWALQQHETFCTGIGLNL